MDAFGPTLDYFCDRQGITLQKLADKMHVDRNTLGNWKRRGRPPSQDDTVKLAEKLYLNEDETNKLLAAAGYASKYPVKETNLTSLPQIETLKVERMVVERFGGSKDSTEHRSASRCDWYAHISMPPIYVERREVITGVRDGLLTETNTIALTSAVQYRKPNALHGMGGIGKSVIARALCDDPKMQMRFPDGILWVTLGREPELVSKMREWVHALGGTITENAPTVDGLKGTLAKLLKDRACLLILDDVWQSAHAEAFGVGGSHCRLLLTTRDAAIAHDLGARILSVPVMTEDEAVLLLEEWADGQLNQVDIQLERQIVKRLGYLPLAVKLAGAQLRRKSPEEWLRTFTVHRLKAHRVEAENIHDSLERTFTLSLNELDENVRRLYVALAIFKEDEAILQVGIERLWQGLGISELETDTADLLDDLAARALLQVDRSSRMVRLHDLLRDFIDAQLKERRIETHRALLSAYRTTWRGTGWDTADDDGYLYDHLAYHLHAAGAIDELKGLFANQQGLHKRVPQRGYTYDGYLNDLMLAWKCADAQARRQIETDQEPTMFADCLRYLLIRTSINSIAGNYMPELVARAVEVGLWTSRRGLSIAAKIPVAIDRANMYIALLERVRLGNEQQNEVQRLGVEAALAIEDERKRAEVLAALVPQLTGEPRIKALERGLEATLALSNERQRAEALKALAPQLTGGLLERGLEAALALSDKRQRAAALKALAPQLTGGLLERVWAAALALSDERQRAEALKALAPQLTGELLERAWAAALALSNERQRAAALKALAPQLTGGLLERGLEAALALSDKQERAEVLAALASQLTGEPRIKALEWGLEAALALSDWLGQRAEALAALAPQLTGGLLERAWAAALALSVGWQRTEALAALAPQLTGGLLERAWAAALALSDKRQRAEVLAALAPQLTGGLLERVWAAALALSDERQRAAALAALAPQLTGEPRIKALERGLEAALALSDEQERAEVLAALVPQLTGEPRIKALERGLEAALALSNERQRAGVLKALAPQLTGRLLERGLEATLALSDERQRAEVLVALVPQLTGEPRIKTLERGLGAALALSDEQELAEILAALAPQLAGGLLERVWAAALALSNEQELAEVLAALAPQLTGGLLERAWAAALALSNERQRAAALKALAPQLTGELLERGLEAALALSDERQRAWVLTVFFPLVADQSQLLRFIRLAMLDYSWRVQNLSRGDVLNHYFIKEIFIPPIFSPETLGAFTSQIIEICEEWVWL